MWTRDNGRGFSASCPEGRRAAVSPGADPEKIKGIYYAVDFLASTTKSLLSSGGRTVQELEKAGLEIVVLIDGEDFTPVREDSQRYLFMVKKEQ